MWSTRYLGIPVSPYLLNWLYFQQTTVFDQSRAVIYVGTITVIYCDAKPTSMCTSIHIECESKKNPPWNFLTFFPNGWELLVQILHAYCTFQSTLDYITCAQLSRSYAIISATTIMCSKCPPSTETHAGWSHLIWHNFVTVGDNWTKFCIITYIWMFNRRLKFGLKIHNCLGKMSENASMHFSQWWTFCTHDVNWVVTLNMA